MWDFLKSSFNYTDANAKILACFQQDGAMDNCRFMEAGELGLGSSIIELGGDSSSVNTYESSKISFYLVCFYFISIKPNSNV